MIVVSAASKLVNGPSVSTWCYTIYLPVAADASPTFIRVAKVPEELTVEFEATPPTDALLVTATPSRTQLTIAAIISSKWKERGKAAN
jgi:hypothetical protein